MIKNSVRHEALPVSEYNALGKGLNILICSEYQFQLNWMTFSAWYSVKKYFPEATIGVTVARPSKIDTYLFNWVYKLDVKYFMHKNVGSQTGVPYLNKLYGTYVALKEGILTQPLLVLEPDMMAVSSLSEKNLENLLNSKFTTSNSSFNLNFPGDPVGSVWGFNNVPLEKFEEAINSVTLFKNENHIDLLALSKVFKGETNVVKDLESDTQEDVISTFTHYRERCGNFVKKEWTKGKTLPPFGVSRSLVASNMTTNENRVVTLWGNMSNLYNSINQIKL